MQRSYFRIRLGRDDALRRFAEWRRLDRTGPLVPGGMADAVDLDRAERGRERVLWVSEASGWTVFHSPSGASDNPLVGLSAADWLAFAQDSEVVVAGCDTENTSGLFELVVVEGRAVIRERYCNPDEPDSDVDAVDSGRLDCPQEPFADGADVADSIRADALADEDREGWVFVYADPT